jgi:hypothetical protein
MKNLIFLIICFLLLQDGYSFVSRKIIAASEDIEEYEVVQTGIDCWEIYLKPPMNATVTDALHELFDRIGAIPPKLVFVREPFSLYPGAKRRRIRREYDLAKDSFRGDNQKSPYHERK